VATVMHLQFDDCPTSR